MPRRYTKKIKLEQLNSTINSKKSTEQATNDTKSISSSESDFDDNEMDKEPSQREEDESGPKELEDEVRRILENTPHFAHFSRNKGMSVGFDDPVQIFPTCSITVPVPLYLANCMTPIVDPCTLRPQACDEWMRQMQIYKARHTTVSKKMEQRELKQENMIYDTYIFDMAEHIATQENSFFRDSYDYYYTAGNLQLMPFKDKTLAMHVSGDKLRTINISEVNASAEYWNPIHSEAIGAEKSSEIFEIINLESYLVNHGHLFLTRHLKEISIYEVKRKDSDDTNYELICRTNFTNQETNFTSAAQSVGQEKHLAVACQDRSIRHMDMSTEQQVSKFDVCMLKSLKQSNSTWAQLLPRDENCFFYAAQPVFLTVDLRCQDNNLSPCFASSLYSQQCESFSCLHRSVNPNLLYVASNHKLHCLDMRQMGKKLSDRSVVTWTHQMNYSPTFMDTCSFEGIEYIALGSALPSDQRLCELKDCLGTMTAPCLPYAPPTLQEALTDASLRDSISIYADLTERIKCCNTGLKFRKMDGLPDNPFAELLTSTSIGDVYCQRLSLRHEEEKREELRTGLHTAEAIRYFANLVEEKVETKQLKCTEVQHVSVLREILKSDNERIAEDEKPLEVEDITIEYGFEESDDDSQAGEESEQQSPGKKQGPQTPAKKQKHPQQSPAHEESPELRTPTSEAAQAEPITKPKQKAVSRGPWQQSAYQLARYKDMITTRLLSVWDLDDYDQTRDVYIDMIDEKLKKDDDDKFKMENRMDSWLKNLTANVPEPLTESKDETLVPGTNLVKHYEAKDADYIEVPLPNIEIPNITAKIEPSFISLQRQHSVLEAGQFTVVECDFEASTSQQAARKRIAKPKSKHTKGF